MLKRHADDVESALETLFYEPMVRISRRKLRYFYSMDRLSKNTWRDFFDRLPGWPKIENLYYIDDGDQVIIIRKSDCKEVSELMN